MALASCLTLACACSSGVDTTSEPTGACPDPPAGVTIGGLPGDGDTQRTPSRRVVIMGGSSENDAAMTLFLEGAAGGDVLILRASGSVTSYPDYFADDLTPSPPLASAVTIRTDDPSMGGHEAVLCRVARAEAVWLAGGDQSDYLIGWPPALHAALAGLAARGVAVGGTSAGAAASGEAAFDAEFGTVTSEEALADPFRQDVSVSYPTFAAPELAGVLVDSHFMQRDREGRLLVFLARFLEDRSGDVVYGLGLDERVGVVVREGRYEIFGPAGRAAWLYRVSGPATLADGQPLGLEGIERVALEPGDEGAWPVDWGDVAAEPMRVQGGVVQAGAGGG